MAIVKIETLEDKYELMNHLPMNETKIKLFQQKLLNFKTY